MAGVKLISVVVLCMIIAPMATQAITCNDVTYGISPCVNYLMGMQPLGADCCNGVRRVNNNAKTTADRRTACRCLKTAASSNPSIIPSLASGLPSACKVNIPYKISISTNCDKIN